MARNDKIHGIVTLFCVFYGMMVEIKQINTGVRTMSESSTTKQPEVTTDNTPPVEPVAQTEAISEPRADTAKKGAFVNALKSLKTNTVYKGVGNNFFAVSVKDEPLALHLYAKNSDNNAIRDLGSYTIDKPYEIYTTLGGIFATVGENKQFPAADATDSNLVKENYKDILKGEPQAVPAALIEKILNSKKKQTPLEQKFSEIQAENQQKEEEEEERIKQSEKDSGLRFTINHTGTVKEEIKQESTINQKIGFSNPVVVLLTILTAGLGLKTVADAQQKPEKQRSWVDKVTTLAAGTLAAGATLATIFTLVNNHANAKSPAPQK